MTYLGCTDYPIPAVTFGLGDIGIAQLLYIVRGELRKGAFPDPLCSLITMKGIVHWSHLYYVYTVPADIYNIYIT